MSILGLATSSLCIIGLLVCCCVAPLVVFSSSSGWRAFKSRMQLKMCCLLKLIPRRLDTVLCVGNRANIWAVWLLVPYLLILLELISCKIAVVFGISGYAVEMLYFFPAISAWCLRMERLLWRGWTPCVARVYWFVVSVSRLLLHFIEFFCSISFSFSFPRHFKASHLLRLTRLTCQLSTFILLQSYF